MRVGDTGIRLGIELPAVPPMALIRQRFDTLRVADPAATVASSVRKYLVETPGRVRPGARIAVTAGSRGIAGYPALIAAVVRELQAVDAEPFIVPAMGSHGGATAEGQLALLEAYKITSDRVGAPIVSSMDTVTVDSLPDGTELHMDAAAYGADGIVLFNKIKPHADFKAGIESGLCKMLVIGLGKHRGAAALHRRGFASFGTAIPEAASRLLRTGKVLFGIGIVENAREETAIVELIRPGDILDRERLLLSEAKRLNPRLLVGPIDILIVDEIGKDISGEGMDPNVTGRPGSYLSEGFEVPPIGVIIVRGLSQATHGNGIGIGMADIALKPCVENLDLVSMYTNAATAGILGPARIPLVADNDEAALRVALAATYAGRSPRIVRIRNTLLLEHIRVSATFLDEIRQRQEDFVVEVDPQKFVFDSDGFFEN